MKDNVLWQLESWFYWVVCLVGLISPLCYSFALSNNHISSLGEGSLKDGLFRLPRDDTDYEWTDYRATVFRIYSVSLVYSVMGVFLIETYPSVKKLYYTCAGALLAVYLTSVQGFLMILTISISFYVVFTVKCSWLNGLTIITFTGLLHEDAARESLFAIFGVSSEAGDAIYISLLMTFIRILSYSTETIGERTNNCQSFVEYLCYIFYYPLFLFGPMLTYDLFRADFNTPSKTKLGDMLKQFVRYSLIAIGVDVFFHFSYVTVFSMHRQLLQSMSVFECWSVSWTLIVMFCTKYFVIYGFAQLMAGIDGIHAPDPPKCVCSLYTFVDMWRYFDRGLYRLMQRSIYRPLGGSRHGVACTALASFSCFAYVALWHGNTKSYWMWAVTNFLGVFGESLVGGLHLGIENPIALRRLKALGGSVSIVALIYSNLIYVTDFETANMIYLKLFSSYDSVAVLFFVFYTSAHVSMDIRDKQKQKL